MRPRSDFEAGRKPGLFKEGSHMELRHLPWGKIALGLGMAGLFAAHPALAQEAATAAATAADAAATVAAGAAARLPPRRPPWPKPLPCRFPTRATRRG